MKLKTVAGLSKDDVQGIADTVRFGARPMKCKVGWAMVCSMIGFMTFGMSVGAAVAFVGSGFAFPAEALAPLVAGFGALMMGVLMTYRTRKFPETYQSVVAELNDRFPGMAFQIRVYQQVTNTGFWYIDSGWQISIAKVVGQV